MRVLRFLAVLTAFVRPLGLCAQLPVPVAPVPRVDSVRVDTLHPPAADSTRHVLMPKVPTVGDTVRKPSIFGPHADLSVDVHTRFEAREERRQDDRCASGFLLGASYTCDNSFNPFFGSPQFTLRSSGTIADRVHVNVDFDNLREFNASNAVNIYYEGKGDDRLQRLEVGNVSFSVPSTRFLSSGVPSGNYGIQAVAQLGRFRVQGIAAQQKGNIVRDRVFYIGDRTLAERRPRDQGQ